MNASKSPILSVDVPSGLNATTGEVNPIAVKANWTVTFALPKKGFYVNEGPYYAGQIFVENIGFSEDLINRALEYEKRNS